MALVIESLHFGGEVTVLVPDVFRDERGFFMETYREDMFRAVGLPTNFVQDNHSGSSKGVVRGLHFQWSPPMGKLMRVTCGAAFLVAVDIRLGSPTFGKWLGIEASADNRKQVWAPYGFARGFCALTDDCEVQYKCTGIYNQRYEAAIRFDDPEIGIEWPISNLIASEKDRRAMTLRDWLDSPLAKNIVYEPELVSRSSR